MSKRHARIIVASNVEVVDDNSANGLVSSGMVVQRLVLAEGDRFQVGDSVLIVEGLAARSAAPESTPVTVAFNRSPRLDPDFVGQEFTAPEAPVPQPIPVFPMVSALIPLVMAAAFILAHQPLASLIFLVMTPAMAAGGYFQGRRTAQRNFEADVTRFEQNLAELVAELRSGLDAERSGRVHEHPATADIVVGVQQLSPLLWARRPGDARFLSLRLGLGTQSSRSTVEVPRGRNAPVDLQRQLDASVKPLQVVDNVPVTCHLPSEGPLGVAGPADVREGVAAGLVGQLVGLHSPAEVTVVAITSAVSSVRWEWLKWLPHVHTDHSPIGPIRLADSSGSVAALLADLAALIDDRSPSESSQPVSVPAVVVIVEDDAPFTRSTMVQIAERGSACGVHVLWFAGCLGDVPAVCRTFVELEPAEFGAAVGKVILGERVEPIIVEGLDAKGRNWLGRRLAPVEDAGVAVDTEADVPSTVSWVSEAGIELLDDPSFVIERWKESNSIRTPDGELRRLKRDNTLRALVGRTSVDPLHLDLRTQGPHALVGGTTGAGKSEFLQTWVLAMAAAHSPQRVTFLFVDYKGGAAFAECVSLPHSVGLVTDLSPHLVQRALRSLNAELRHREHLLNRTRAKDLLEMERRDDPETPPSLVIVVDEFAALVQEVPEFVDGVVNIAQRGRSLGLHLILATQRPAGVIKGNLRANTNLRVALRMADADDSNDVVGVPSAGTFDPSVPGRGLAKTGPGRLSLFQTGYVGGNTTGERRVAPVDVRDLTFGSSDPWDDPWDEGFETSVGGTPFPSDDTDIGRVVETLRRASDQAGLEPPRRPWLPELADLYDLAALPDPAPRQRTRLRCHRQAR